MSDSSDELTDEEREVEDRLDAFLAEVWRRRPELVGQPDLDGFRRATAAALLFRGLELLATTRVCPGKARAPATQLLLRTAVEVALRGRYLLLAPEAQATDELARMHDFFVRKGEEVAKACDADFAGVAPSFAAAVPRSPHNQRGLHTIARTLDAHDGLTLKDEHSAMRAYRCIYQWLSNAAAHGGLGALSRIVVGQDGKAAINPNPEPLTTGRRLYVIIGGLLGDLARDVFVAFGVSTDDLDATGVRWSPLPSHN